MITVDDLLALVRHHPSGTSGAPNYAIAGGSGVLCWLGGSNPVREHDDIDLYCFAGERAALCQTGAGLAVMRLTPQGLSEDRSATGVDVEVTAGSYFHAEITPSVQDVREVILRGTSLPVLSPEFLLVSKLSYPSAHRVRDIQDVIALNGLGSSRRADEVERLLAQTSLAALVTAEAVLGIRTWDDYRKLALQLQACLIRRFLRCSSLDVERLEPLHLFTLLDVEPPVLEPPQDIRRWVDALVRPMTPNVDRLQLARLGLYLALSHVPNPAKPRLIQNRGIEQIVYHLVFKSPGHWLGNAKTVYYALRDLAAIEVKLAQPGVWTCQPEIVVRIVDRIFFRDPSVFTLLATLRALRRNPTTDGNALAGAFEALGLELAPEPQRCLPRPSDYAMFPWIFARRRAGSYPKHSMNGGKWIFSVPRQHADELWARVEEEVERGNLGELVKINTAYNPANGTADNYSRTLCAYTYDADDEADKALIGERLRSLGAPVNMYYKTDRESRRALRGGMPNAKQG